LISVDRPLLSRCSFSGHHRPVLIVLPSLSGSTVSLALMNRDSAPNGSSCAEGLASCDSKWRSSPWRPKTPRHNDAYLASPRYSHSDFVDLVNFPLAMGHLVSSDTSYRLTLQAFATTSRPRSRKHFECPPRLCVVRRIRSVIRQF